MHTHCPSHLAALPLWICLLAEILLTSTPQCELAHCLRAAEKPPKRGWRRGLHCSPWQKNVCYTRNTCALVMHLNLLRPASRPWRRRHRWHSLRQMSPRSRYSSGCELLQLPSRWHSSLPQIMCGWEAVGPLLHTRSLLGTPPSGRRSSPPSAAPAPVGGGCKGAPPRTSCRQLRG